MIERVPSTRRAVLIAIDFGQDGFPESLEELKLLAQSAGMSPLATVQGKRSKPDPALYIGSGKVQEVKKSLQGHFADVAIFNHSLSPAQERNLANALDVQVVDRTRLILDIFGRRARSHEGKLQVELAQLEHAATRLVRGWTHLERQRGGRGFLGGMGETQLEVDRRLIASRVKVLKSKLEKLKRQRSTQRRSRERTGVPSVSLVGYTNAGKSTVFNGLTHADAYAADQLFATLDTTSRRVFLEDAGPMVVSDTVGFIRELPHTLVEAFRTTLEETVRADLLLHVVDASSSARDEQIAEVEKVLQEIGASDIPQILVWNKIDLLDAGSASAPAIDRDEYGKISRVRTSAKSGVGMELLRQALAETAILSALSSRPGAIARPPHQS
jgi:GTP-binding protein HflX